MLEQFLPMEDGMDFCESGGQFTQKTEVGMTLPLDIVIPQLRVVKLYGHIGGNYSCDMQTVRQITTAMELLAADGSQHPIFLDISSEGGWISTGFTLFSMIEQIQKVYNTPVVGTVYGHAESTACFVLEACNVRRLVEHGWLMFHGAFLEIGDDGGDTMHLESSTKHMKAVQKEIARIFEVRTKKPAPFWEKMMQTNTPRYFWGKEALEVGLIDQII